MLPAAVKATLTKHLEHVHQLHQRDLERGFGRVFLPEALQRKYPNAAREWGGSGCSQRHRSVWTHAPGNGVGIICTNRSCNEQ